MSLRTIARAAIAVAVMAGGAALPAAPAMAAVNIGWRITKVLPVNWQVDSVAATAPGDAWAAGTSCGNPCTTQPLLAAHWNGSGWSHISPPKGLMASVGGAVVAASSASNAWFFANVGARTDYTEAVRWNGTAWAGATRFPAWSAIRAAITFSPANAWAFGLTISPSAAPFVVHYNGTKWSKVAFPVFPEDVSALSATNIWVIGQTVGPKLQMVAVHWNGHSWRRITLPPISLPSGEALNPQNITAVSANNVWADAFPSKGEGVAPGIVLLHWNGRAWSRVRVPYFSAAPNYLAQDGAGGIWLSSYNSSYRPVLYHDGKGTWSKVTVPAQPGNNTQLQGLAWVPRTHSVWGGGFEYPYPNNPSGISLGVILKYGP